VNIDLTINKIKNKIKRKEKEKNTLLTGISTTSKYSQAWRARGSRPSLWVPQEASDSHSFSCDQRMKPKREKQLMGEII